MAEIWIKFCGCTSSMDVELAAQAGAGAFGMVFAPSPRRVTWQAANDIAARLPPAIEPVAVFVNPTRSEVEKVRSLFPEARLQFSGDESPEFVADYGERAIKTIHVGGDPGAVEEAAGRFPYALLLLDTRHAAGLALERRVVVGGGLTPENVAACIDRLSPFGVDVCSGVETDGRKDPAKMRAFVRAARRR